MNPRKEPIKNEILARWNEDNSTLSFDLFVSYRTVERYRQELRRDNPDLDDCRKRNGGHCTSKYK